MPDLFSIPEHEIYEFVFGYAKVYPDMTKLFLYDKPIKVRVSGYEPQVKKVKPRTNSFDDPMTLIDSIRRTKTRLSDLVVSNQFDLFCTFTFAEDRQNIDLLKHKMSRWLKNQNRFAGHFKYLIVPEFHKDGKSIHFHALFKDYKGELIDSGHKRKDGRVVYNIKNYELGFSTATKIDSEGVPLVSSYIKKYITKDMPQFNGKKRYWCSHNLTRPQKIRNPILFPSHMEKFTEEHQMQNMALKIARERIDMTSADHKGKLLS